MRSVWTIPQDLSMNNIRPTIVMTQLSEFLRFFWWCNYLQQNLFLACNTANGYTFLRISKMEPIQIKKKVMLSHPSPTLSN